MSSSKICILGIKGIPASYGGFETCVDETARRLVRKGHAVVVYVRSSNIKYREPFYDGVRLVRLPSIATKSLDTLSHTLISVLHVLFVRTDVVHVYGVGNSLVLPILKLFGKKVVISVDGLDWRRSKWGPFARWFLRHSERIAVRFADRLIIDSRAVQKYYEKEYSASSDYIAYGASVDLVKESDALRKYGLKKPYILFVGRLIPEKGVHYLVEAYKRMNSSIRDTTDLVIIGDDLYKGEYASRLMQEHSSNIHFLGFVYGDDYRQICSRALLYVQPSDLEGTSPSLLAAMGYGNCVLVSNIPENSETVGDAGITFCKGDVADLSSKMESVISTPSQLNELRRKAVTRVSTEFNWDVVTNRLEKLYHDVKLRRNGDG